MVGAATGEPVSKVTFVFLTPDGSIERDLPDLESAMVEVDELGRLRAPADCTANQRRASGAPELHPQRLDPPQHHPGLPGRAIVGGHHPWESPHQHGQSDLRLEACEGGAEAMVRPTAEGGVLIGAWACQIQIVRRRPPLLGISIGRAEAEKKDRTRGDLDIVDLDRFHHDAA